RAAARLRDRQGGLRGALRGPAPPRVAARTAGGRAQARLLRGGRPDLTHPFAQEAPPVTRRPESPASQPGPPAARPAEPHARPRTRTRGPAGPASRRPRRRPRRRRGSPRRRSPPRPGDGGREVPGQVGGEEGRCRPGRGDGEGGREEDAGGEDTGEEDRGEED